MKDLTLVVATFVCLSIGVSVNIHAGEENEGLPKVTDSWEQLIHDSRVIFDFPMIQMEGWFISANNVCVSGHNLRSKNKVEDCIQREANERGDCIKTKYRFVYQPITSLETGCVRWESNERNECTHFGRSVRTIPLEQDVAVYKFRHGSGQLTNLERAMMYPPLFEKKFTIAPCL